MNDSPSGQPSRCRRLSLLLSQIAFFNGMVMANGFAIASIALLCFQIGDADNMIDRFSIGELFLLLSLGSFALSWIANTRYNRLSDMNSKPGPC